MVFTKRGLTIEKIIEMIMIRELENDFNNVRPINQQKCEHCDEFDGKFVSIKCDNKSPWICGCSYCGINYEIVPCMGTFLNSTLARKTMN
jgi:hypothetical protein